MVDAIYVSQISFPFEVIVFLSIPCRTVLIVKHAQSGAVRAQGLHVSLSAFCFTNAFLPSANEVAER